MSCAPRCWAEDMDVVFSFPCASATRTIARRVFRDHEHHASPSEPLKQLEADYRRCFFQDTVSGTRPSFATLRCIVSSSCCPHKLVASMTQTGMVPAVTLLMQRFPGEHVGEVRDNRSFPMFVKMFSWTGTTVVQTCKRVRSFVVDSDGNDVTKRLFNIVVLHIGSSKGCGEACRCKTTFSVQECECE